MKCEVNGCTKSTDTYLCKGHQDMAEKKNAVFKICKGILPSGKECGCIVSIEIKIRPKNKHIFVDECENCKFFK